MENYKVLLSIIIPTKNRYESLIPVISALLKNIETDDIEFVIQDNSNSNQAVLVFFENLKDSRVKYFYHSEELSIQDNTIFAIENASGKYLTFIGDDDLVSPYIYYFVKYLDKKNIECLVFNSAYYWWNTVQFQRPNNYHRKNALWIPKGQSIKLFERLTDVELNNMLKSGAGAFLRLPKFYHGIVRRDVLEEIKKRTGTYLCGSSPDIAFSTSLSLVLEKYYFINFPLTVFGASKNSGGGMTVSNKHFGKIEDQKFLPKNIIERWNKFVPKIWSERTIYAQTVTEVLKSFDSKRKFNYINFYATMFAYESHLSKFIFPSVISYCNLNLLLYINITYVYIKKLVGIGFRELKILTNKFDYEVELSENVFIVMEKLKATKINFKNLDSNQ